MTRQAVVDQTWIQQMKIGDEISAGGVNWVITGDPTFQANDMDIASGDLEPQVRAQENKYQFTLTRYSPLPIDYLRINNHYASVGTMQGLYGEDVGYTGLTTDDHAYSVDIEVQQALLPEDWQLMMYGG